MGIQGGPGIIKPVLIDLFSDEILNVHPGDLPSFRGCSAPEWQLYKKKNVICTVHLIDEGIDSGRIVSKKKLDVDKYSYKAFRASLYPMTALFV